MTYEEQLQYYADLLIIQYRSQPRAQATIQALARESLIDNLPLTLQDCFNLDSAVGAQLDVLATFANVQRQILTFEGGATLTDDELRTLIYLALARAGCQGSLKDIDDLLLHFFGNAIQAFDNANMQMGYFFNSSFGSLALAEAFVRLDLLPRPMGVGLSSLIYAGNLTNVFGMCSYYAAAFEVSGVQFYDDYDTTPNALPWLSYVDIVSF